MCITDVYTYTYHRRHIERVKESVLCERSSQGAVCDREYRCEHPIQHVAAFQNIPSSHSHISPPYHVPQYNPSKASRTKSHQDRIKPLSSSRRSSSGIEVSSNVHPGSQETLDRTCRERSPGPHDQGCSGSRDEWLASSTLLPKDTYIVTSRDATDQGPTAVDEATSPSKRRVHFKLPSEHYSDSKASRVEHDSYEGSVRNRRCRDKRRQQHSNEHITAVDAKTANYIDPGAADMLRNQEWVPISYLAQQSSSECTRHPPKHQRSIGDKAQRQRLLERLQPGDRTNGRLGTGGYRGPTTEGYTYSYRW
ncbi:hypothetical protein FSARC_14830 [Fusarium sarcochroum]|uniref:Uncharacterized protein n=1 Tax=Fusarium sarcochroum TaxID=1208366 RepID=A0A8H4SQR1_9HYPO|nr:hypothetical protein FSARC_14830 [Fusarium sarcochroum]